MDNEAVRREREATVALDNLRLGGVPKSSRGEFDLNGWAPGDDVDTDALVGEVVAAAAAYFQL